MKQSPLLKPRMEGEVESEDPCRSLASLERGRTMETNGMVYRMDAPLHRALWIRVVISLTEIGKLRTAGKFKEKGLSRTMAWGRGIKK